MAIWNGDDLDNAIDWSDHPLDGPNDPGHFMYGYGGNDTIFGGIAVPNLILGGTGSDQIQGGDQPDTLIGDDGLYGPDGNDTIYGGGGDDSITGAAGNDVLYGANGNDVLRGNFGDDLYDIFLGDTGMDIIADDLDAMNGTGAGGGTLDAVELVDAPVESFLFFQSGNDLQITDQFDMADGVFDDGVTIVGFFLGGNNVIELAYGAEGTAGPYWDLTQFLPPSPAASAEAETASADQPELVPLAATLSMDVASHDWFA